MQLTLTHLTTAFVAALFAGAASAAPAPAVLNARQDPPVLKSNTFILHAIADPEAATPLSSPYTQVSYANSTAYIGDIKYQTYAQPLILGYPHPEAGRLSFTSYHSSPTGWQNLYIYPAASSPIGFTTPHSAFVPPNASPAGFTVDVGATELLGYEGENGKWFACPVEGFADGIRRIVYNGASEPLEGCTKVTLKAEAYGFPN